MIRVHPSALKHGVTEDDILRAVSNDIRRYYLDDDMPTRELVLGFDSAGRLLELVLLKFENGNSLVIHKKVALTVNHAKAAAPISAEMQFSG